MTSPHLLNQSVVDIAAVRALLFHHEGMRAFIPSSDDTYRFEEANTDADDGVLTLRPDNVLGAAGAGRWVKVLFDAGDLDPAFANPLYTHKGGYNAATNTPDLDTAPAAGTITLADAYTVTADGLFFTEQVRIGDVLVANQDDPTLLTDWTRIQRNIDLATEATAGLVELATDGEDAALVAVQGNDARIRNALHSDIAGEIAAIGAKGTAVGADTLLINDSEDGDNPKSLLISTLFASPTFTGIVTIGSATHASGGLRIDNDNAATDGISLSRTSGTAREWNLHIDTAGHIQFRDITASATAVIIEQSGDIRLLRDTEITGNLFPNTSNLRDFGSVTEEWRTGYFGTSVFIGTGQEVEINSTQILNVDGTAANPPYSFASNTNTGFRHSGSEIFVVLDAVDEFRLISGQLILPAGTSIGWTSSTVGAARDTILVRDGAANTLAQRNGVNAQVFRVYNTFTDSSNHERAIVAWSGSSCFIGTESAGTGTDRDVRITTNGGTNYWRFAPGALPHFTPNDSNAFDVGSATGEIRSLYVGTSILFGIGQSVTLAEGATDLLELATGDSFQTVSGFIRAGGSAGTADAFFALDNGATVADSPVGEARIRYNDSTGTLQASVNGVTYRDFDFETAIFHLSKFNANDAVLPSSSPAGLESRNGHDVLAYNDSVDENVEFHSIMPNDYKEGAIAAVIDWVAATATSGVVKWNVQIERIAPGGQDIDSDGFDPIQTVTGSTNGTSGIVTRTVILLNQAEADDIEKGDAFRLRVTRDADDGGDTMVGDAQVLRVAITQ